MRFVFHSILASAAIFLSAQSTFAQAKSVRDFGAKGDGVADDTQAFSTAFASGAKSILVPSGTYLLGSSEMDIPENVRLFGEGPTSVIKAKKDAATIFNVKSGVQVSDLLIDGADVKQGHTNDPGLFMSRATQNISFKNLTFKNVNRVCIMVDHVDHAMLMDSKFEKIGLAMHIIFSNWVKVMNNSVIDASLHGFQVWGNDSWKKKGSSNITFTGNMVKNGGFGAIWGTGIVRCIMNDNIVDGAEDVGLDLEWCEDSTIVGNSVSNCKNGGISLFFACERITITGNTVINNYPVSDEEKKKDWWVRAGIWLTYPNRTEFPGDYGHKDITIVGNTITCTDGPGRRAIWIGSESKNLSIGLNTLNGGKIVGGGVDQVKPLVLNEIPENSKIDKVLNEPKN